MRKQRFIALTLVGLLAGTASAFSQQSKKVAVDQKVTTVEVESIKESSKPANVKPANSSTSATTIEVTAPNAVSREVKKKPARKTNYSTQEAD